MADELFVVLLIHTGERAKHLLLRIIVMLTGDAQRWFWHELGIYFRAVVVVVWQSPLHEVKLKGGDISLLSPPILFKTTNF